MRLIRGAAFLFVLASTAAAQDSVRTVTLLHTNDLHARLLPLENGAGGFARLAAVIRRERENCDSCLLLNAGDLVQGSPVSTIFHGIPVFEMANLFGFDAATLGNHEFDYGWQTARKFIEIAHYPVVCANVVDGSGALLAPKPYVILTANGVRVAVIGVLTATIDRLSTPQTRGPWTTLPVVETLRRYAAEARGQADLIIALGHLTTREEVEMLKSVPEVPIAITGHDHRGLNAALKVEGREVVRVKGYGEELGRLEVRVDLKRKEVVSTDWRRIPVTGNAVAQDVDREVKRWESEVTKVVDTPIGESRKALTRAELQRLIEQAMAEEMHTDLAFINIGGLRDNLPQGRLLARHIWNIMPFDNIVVTARIQGRDLSPVLAGGRAIDPERYYTIATSDFTAANQGEIGTHGVVFTTDGPLLRDLLIGWIKKKKVVE